MSTQYTKEPILFSDFQYAIRIKGIINEYFSSYSSNNILNPYSKYGILLSSYSSNNTLNPYSKYEILLGELDKCIKVTPPASEDRCMAALRTALTLPNRASYEHHIKVLCAFTNLTTRDTLRSISFWYVAKNNSELLNSALRNYEYRLFYFSHETDKEKMAGLLDILDEYYPSKHDENMSRIIRYLGAKLYFNLNSITGSVGENVTTLLALLKPYFEHPENNIPRDQYTTILLNLKPYVDNVPPAIDDGYADILLAALNCASSNPQIPRN